jgi:hypothetical protein
MGEINRTRHGAVCPWVNLLLPPLLSKNSEWILFIRLRPDTLRESPGAEPLAVVVCGLGEKKTPGYPIRLFGVILCI